MPDLDLCFHLFHGHFLRGALRSAWCNGWLGCIPAIITILIYLFIYFFIFVCLLICLFNYLFIHFAFLLSFIYLSTSLFVYFCLQKYKGMYFLVLVPNYINSNSTTRLCSSYYLPVTTDLCIRNIQIWICIWAYVCIFKYMYIFVKTSIPIFAYVYTCIVYGLSSTQKLAGVHIRVRITACSAHYCL